MDTDAETNVINIEDKTLEQIKPYSPIKDSGESLKAFMGLFKPAAVRCSPIVIEFIEAPLPKVSHVRQVTDDWKEKWNLPMVTNRYIKKEFFISTGLCICCNISLSFDVFIKCFHNTKFSTFHKKCLMF